MTKTYPILIGIIVFFTYLGGLNGQFQFDDYPNIVQNERLHIKTLTVESITRSAFSSSSGILKRPISMMSFAINHYFSNLNPFSYKVTNLAIHIINCIGIYWICLQLLNSVKSKKYFLSNSNIALIVSLAWGLHPINLTAVLYVVQRMTSLATMFTIVAIGLYLKARQELHDKRFRKGLIYLLLVVIFGLLGVLSKENAALLFLYLFIIEWVLYKEDKYSQEYNTIIIIFYVLFLLIPALIVLFYTTNNPGWIFKGYNVTNFSLIERGLTELRILWMYIYWILIPDNSNLGFFHDDIILSRNILDSTLPLLFGLGHIIVIWTILYLWKKQQNIVFVLGISLFYASHLLESTILPLMLTFEHRNYFGSFGLLLATCSLLFSINNKYKTVIKTSAMIYIFFISILTSQRASTWGYGINNALVDIQHHPESATAHYELGRQYSLLEGIENRRKSKIHFIKSAALDEERADALFALLMVSARNNKPTKKDVVVELNQRLITGPVYASHVTWMSSLVKCFMNNKCLINKDEVVNLIKSALSNKRLDKVPLSKSYYLMIAADLLANKGNNYKEALEFSILSANTSPHEVKFLINVINLALANKDHSTADTWIAKFDNNFSDLYPQEIKEFKKLNKELIEIDR